jgi:hypothetical protein
MLLLGYCLVGWCLTRTQYCSDIGIITNSDIVIMYMGMDHYSVTVHIRHCSLYIYIYICHM